MVACRTGTCQKPRVYNRPFVKYCRRCGEEIDQNSLWEEIRRDGWNLVPKSFDDPEVIADLSPLWDANSPVFLLAVAMIRGVLAVHHAGEYLALVKAAPGAVADPFLWSEAEDPFPASPDGMASPPNTPTLLPDQRHVMFSCPQGVLVLDLWSCHGIAAKDNDPRVRLIRVEQRSLVVPPIPLDEHRIGLVTRGWGDLSKTPYRWAVWDRSLPPEKDAELAARLETEHLDPLPIEGARCRCEVVDDRVIAFSTVRQQWVWKRSDAASSEISRMKPTWPGRETAPNHSIVLDDPGEFQTANTQAPQAILVHHPGGGRRRGIEKFSWYFCVRRDDQTNLESSEHYERYAVEFESLNSEIPQKYIVPSGARPIGAAPARNEIRRMIFRVGPEIWCQDDSDRASLYQPGLPYTIVSHQLAGPLILSVGEKDRGTRYIQIDSLHHEAKRAEVSIPYKLLADPLLWHRWLFTIELDRAHRLLICRRLVRFEEPIVRT